MAKKRIIPNDQLIINDDGSIFHICMKPSQLKDNVILVGDPNRVAMISSLLDSVLDSGENREFKWVSGNYKNKEITILSTGIGSDNIDIVMNELDALANINFTDRVVKEKHRKLNIIRLGTCGVVDENINTGEILISRYAIGIDSLLNFYNDRNNDLNYDMATSFSNHMNWTPKLSAPYAVECSKVLLSKFSSLGTEGITITSPGFYAPQSRMLRIEPSIENFLDNASRYRYDNNKIINLEMEAAPIMALSKLMEHSAITLCVGIAARKKDLTALSYHEVMENLAKDVLDRL